AVAQLGHGRGQLEAGGAGHLDVGDQHVRLVLLHERQGLVAVAGLGDDLDVALQLQQRRQGAAHHGLVLGDDDLHVVACAPSDEAAGAPPRASSGSLTSSTVVLPVDRSDTAPPSASTRERMPERPLPKATPSGSVPSSVTVSSADEPRASSRTWQRLAPACLTTFVTPSRNASARAPSAAGGRSTRSK